MIQVIARSPFVSCLDSKCFNKKSYLMLLRG